MEGAAGSAVPLEVRPPLRRRLPQARFLDLGKGRVLRLPEHFVPAGEMTGMLYTRASVEAWLKDGARLERFALPPPPPPSSRYDPPYMEQYRTPDAWLAHQEQGRRRIFGADVPQPEEPPGPLAAEVQAVTTEEEWLAAMLRIVPDVGLEACRKLQRETAEKYRKGELAEPDAVKILNLIKARMEALEGAPQVTLPVAAPAAPGPDPRSEPGADSLSGAGSGRRSAAGTTAPHDVRRRPRPEAPDL